MALNSIEQLQLIEEGFTNITQPLQQVIFQTALNTAVNFTQSEKDVSPGGVLDQDASSYLAKMKRIIRMLQEGNRSIANNLTEVMIARVGVNVAADFATVQGATEAQILGFFNNNMLDVLESFAQTSLDEKAAYDALA